MQVFRNKTAEYADMHKPLVNYTFKVCFLSLLRVPMASGSPGKVGNLEMLSGGRESAWDFVKIAIFREFTWNLHRIF